MLQSSYRQHPPSHLLSPFPYDHLIDSECGSPTSLLQYNEGSGGGDGPGSNEFDDGVSVGRRGRDASSRRGRDGQESPVSVSSGGAGGDSFGRSRRDSSFGSTGRSIDS